MNYTIKPKSTSDKSSSDLVALPPKSDNFGSSAVGTLTNYKRVVDKDDTLEIYERHKIVYYGLSKNDLALNKEKIKKQKDFLNYSYIYDRINQNKIALADIFMSATHSPNRYYAEIQNRVNTLTTLAKERNLKPLFMTITLPSEYHRCKTTKKGKLIPNPKYNRTSPKDATKVLTKMFARLRHDRSLKEELDKEHRIYFRVNEPHKDGTPHTHILMFIPFDRIEGVTKAFQRLFDIRGNDIQSDIRNAASYIMKYINKTLPLSKADKLSAKDTYLNAWYSKNSVIRFSSSRTLAPLSIYRLLHAKYSMYALTRLLRENHLKIYLSIDTNQVVEILNEWDEVVYMKSSNYNLVTPAMRFRGSYFLNNSQTNDSAIGMSA